MSIKIHPSADVKSTDIGDNTYIWQNCVVLDGARIGNNCNLNCNCFVENDVVLGNDVTVKSGVYIWSGITVGDSVFIGPCVAFTNDLLPRSKKYLEEFQRIDIRKGASIGANATIVAPAIIGEYAMIGAGSVVTKDIPPYTIWYGNPARHKGYITPDGLKVSMDLTDSEGRKYVYENKILTRL